jgi:hypothetical protein
MSYVVKDKLKPECQKFSSFCPLQNEKYTEKFNKQLVIGLG